MWRSSQRSRRRRSVSIAAGASIVIPAILCRPTTPSRASFSASAVPGGGRVDDQPQVGAATMRTSQSTVIGPTSGCSIVLRDAVADGDRAPRPERLEALAGRPAGRRPARRAARPRGRWPTAAWRSATSSRSKRSVSSGSRRKREGAPRNWRQTRLRSRPASAPGRRSGRRRAGSRRPGPRSRRRRRPPSPRADRASAARRG